MRIPPFDDEMFARLIQSAWRRFLPAQQVSAEDLRNEFEKFGGDVDSFVEKHFAALTEGLDEDLRELVRMIELKTGSPPCHAVEQVAALRRDAVTTKDDIRKTLSENHIPGSAPAASDEESSSTEKEVPSPSQLLHSGCEDSMFFVYCFYTPLLKWINASDLILISCVLLAPRALQEQERSTNTVQIYLFNENTLLGL